MSSLGFSSWPSFTVEEAEAVQAVLLSNRVNYWGGEEGRAFEREFAAVVDCEYAVALANGTVALDLALKALGVGPGDEVVVTPRSFIASASCVVTVGAVPVFADVDADSQSVTAESIKVVLTEKTRAIIAVHLAGWPCEMQAIMALAREYGLWVIEDCAQAHGASYYGRSVGSFGHVAAWSFCQDKIMTTGGEGGMLTTNDRNIWKAAWEYKDHGKSWSAVYEREHLPGFRWLHESFGTNWRMTEMQAAIGRVQIRRLPDWINTRRRNATLLQSHLENCEAIRVPHLPEHIGHAYYKYYVFVRPERLAPGWTRNRLMNEIQAQGVPCFSGICPEVYLEKAFQESGLAPAERLPEAKVLGETSLMFVVHPTLTEQDMDKMSAIVSKVIKKATIGNAT